MASKAHALPALRPKLEPRFPTYTGPSSFWWSMLSSSSYPEYMQHTHTSAAGRVDLNVGMASGLIVGGVVVGVMGRLW